ncbi:MAG: alanine--glyoxylate aminotransferase family protein [Bacillota bacterium]|nr:alanine--glyoxylate aminotransferase family protein [Bacillota bacterium]
MTEEAPIYHAPTPALHLPERLLLGPGPSPVPARVLQALATPTLGHLDPAFLDVMNETMDALRAVFGTTNPLTMALSGTGSAGMEALFVNLVEPGDRVLIGVNGLFGERMVDVARRAGADVITVEAPWGRIVDPEAIRRALDRSPGVRLVALVLAETSTGVRQPLEEVARIVHEHEALLGVDAVTALGGIPVEVDRVGIDACYAGTQKCLSVPPGLAPLTLGPRAEARLDRRTEPVRSWYLDMTMIRRYWGHERFYHHTAPVNMLFALHEGLRLILEEGLPAVYERHARVGAALQRGLEAMGLELFAEPGHRLPELTTVRVPAGVDDARVRARLLEEYGIEIGAGVGPTRGQIWRIGLMGHGARKRNVFALLSALESLLAEEGHPVPRGAGLEAAAAALGEERPAPATRREG